MYVLEIILIQVKIQQNHKQLVVMEKRHQLKVMDKDAINQVVLHQIQTQIQDIVMNIFLVTAVLNIMRSGKHLIE